MAGVQLSKEQEKEREMALKALKKGLSNAKKAKQEKPHYFAFVGEDKEGELIVDKKPIKLGDKRVKKAKDRTGCQKVVIGKCHGHSDKKQAVFLTKKKQSPSMKAWFTVISQDAGFKVLPCFEIDTKTPEQDAKEEAAALAEPDVDEDEGEESAEGADALTPDKSEAADAEKADDGVLQDKDLGTWQTAREEACKKLRLLAKEVARTKHASAGPVLGEIDSIIKKLPLVPKRKDIDSLIKLVQTDPTIKAAEASPKHFFDLDITTDLVSSLESLKS
jgi:hypothetical protein